MIKPEDIKSKIEADVEHVVDDLLQKRWDGRSAVLTQSEIITALMDKMGVSRQYVFNKKLLDFEQAYRDVGWHVYYDKPGYNESYEPTFTFTKKENK